MNVQQAAKIIKENAMYLALFADEEGHEQLKAALFAQMLEAKQVLLDRGVVAV